MQNSADDESRITLRRSLWVKVTATLAICLLGIFVAFGVLEHRSNLQKLDQDMMRRADEVTQLLALQAGAAIQTGDATAADTVLGQAMAQVGRDAIAAITIDRAGKTLATTDMAGNGTGLRALAKQAATTGAPAFDSQTLIAATPVFSGAEQTLIGAVATQWTNRFARAELAAAYWTKVMIGFAVLAGALGVLAAVVRRLVFMPLSDLGQAMAQITAGEDADVVPHADRHDEIGQMARHLDRCRISFSQSRAARRETAFRKAAFAASSAPMMMLDDGFKVISTNPACEKLLVQVLPDIEKIWPDFGLENLIGTDLRQFAELQDMFDQFAKNSDQHASDQAPELIQLGDRVIQTMMYPATDADGAEIGCVIDWHDRTQAHRNATLIGALDAGQITVEYDLNGTIADANDNFLNIIGGDTTALSSLSLARMFRGNIDGDTDGTVIAARVLAGDVTQGRFSVRGGSDADPRIMDGIFALVPDHNGAPGRMIFLGTDVTDQAHAVEQATAARAAAAAEQAEMVKLIGEALNKLSEGDLQADIDAAVPAGYEKLRRDFNGTVESLRSAIAAVMHNSVSIRKETKEITTAADDLSRRTEKQAATLEETAAALDELTVSVKSAAEGADDASRMSAEAQKNAEQGGEIARQAVVAMDGIKASSKEISKITDVIDDIAFQTNLLALNAGVEAARAGEAGRGFAVVATEVRALSQRSSDAAREINALITSSGEQVNQGVQSVDRTGAALARIVKSVSEISSRVANIATSAREQSIGLEEINTAVNELDHVTQQNAAMFEETTAARHALTAEADALAAAVARFQLDRSQMPSAPLPRPTVVPPPSPHHRPTFGVNGNAALDLSLEEEADGWEEF